MIDFSKTFPQIASRHKNAGSHGLSFRRGTLAKIICNLCKAEVSLYALRTKDSAYCMGCFDKLENRINLSWLGPDRL